jgi:hypothetical protein
MKTQRPGRACITALAEQSNISRDKAKAILDQAGFKRDMYREYSEADALEVLQAAVDQSRAVGNHLAGRGSDASAINLNSVAAARARAEQARADKIELELDERRKNLISKSAVIDAASAFALHVRNGLLAVGDKAAAQCVGKSADQIAATINGFINEALSDLSDVDAYIMREVIGQ